MPKFDKRFVYFMWDDELQGKKVCYSDSLDELWQEVVNSKDNRTLCEKSKSIDYPFNCGIQNWRFVYYDPFFDLKLAHEQGKVIERFWKSEQEWEEWINDEFPGDLALYRIKPEEENPVTNKELAFWLVRGNGQIYHYDDTGFRTEVKTSHGYHQDEDNDDCNINSNFHCKIRKWGDTEWVTPSREYMGLDE